MSMNFRLMEQTGLNQAGVEVEGRAFRHESGMTLLLFHDNRSAEVAVNVTVGTPAIDHKGASHIVEHCIAAEPPEGLRALRRYAATYQDKTSYEFILEQGEPEQIRLVLKGIFNPAFKADKAIFLREGWRTEEQQGRRFVRGVVLNEVRDLLSSPIYRLIQLAPFTLYPNSVHGNIAGGLPAEIVKVTYEEVIGYHETYYVPERCCMYIYGNLENDGMLEAVDRFFTEGFRHAANASAVSATAVSSVSDPVFCRPISYYESRYPAIHESVSGHEFIGVNYPLAKPRTQGEYNAYYWLERRLSEEATADLAADCPGKIFKAVFKNSLLRPYLALMYGFCPEGAREAAVRYSSALLDRIGPEAGRADIPNYIARLIDRARGRSGLLKLGHYIMEAHFGGLPAFAYIRESKDRSDRERWTALFETQFRAPRCAVVRLKPGRDANDGEIAANGPPVASATVLPSRDTSPADAAPPPFRIVGPRFPSPVQFPSRFSNEPPVRPPECEPTVIAGVEGYVYPQQDEGHYAHLYFEISSLKAGQLGWATILARSLNLGLSALGFGEEIRVSCTSCWDEERSEGRSFLRVSLYEDSLNRFDRLLNECRIMMDSPSLQADGLGLERELNVMKANLDLTLMTDVRSLILLRALSYTSSCSHQKDALRGIAFYRSLAALLRETGPQLIARRLAESAAGIFTRSRLIVSVYTHDQRNALKPIERMVRSLDPGCAWPSGKVFKALHGRREGFISASPTQQIVLCSDLTGSSLKASPRLKALCGLVNDHYLLPVLRQRLDVYACEMSVIENHLLLAAMKAPHLDATLEVFRGTGKYMRANLAAIKTTLTDYARLHHGRTQPKRSTPWNDLATVKQLTSPGNREEWSSAFAGRADDTAKEEELLRVADLADKVAETGSYCIIGNSREVKNNSRLFSSIDELLIP